MKVQRIALLLSLALIVACSDDPTPPPTTDPAPDFSIQDVNPNSKRSGQMVSPRDYLQSISAWYFGHAT